MVSRWKQDRLHRKHVRDRRGESDSDAVYVVNVATGEITEVLKGIAVGMGMTAGRLGSRRRCIAGHDQDTMTWYRKEA